MVQLNRWDEVGDCHSIINLRQHFQFVLSDLQRFGEKSSKSEKCPSVPDFPLCDNGPVVIASGVYPPYALFRAVGITVGGTNTCIVKLDEIVDRCYRCYSPDPKP